MAEQVRYGVLGNPFQPGIVIDFYGVPIGSGGGVGWPNVNGNGPGNLTAQTPMADTVGYNITDQGSGGISLTAQGSKGITLLNAAAGAGLLLENSQAGAGGGIGILNTAGAGTAGIQIENTNGANGGGILILDNGTGGISLQAGSGQVTGTTFTPIDNAITAVANAATIPVTSKVTSVTNNSAAALTLTLATSGAKSRQPLIVCILDASAAAQTLTFVNTENSTVSVPATSNGSTTLPLTVGFMFNAATSKWRCVAVA